jgi:Ca2+-transporting ATPase
VLIGAVGALATALVAAGYVRSLGPTGDVPHARAMALAVLTLSSAVLTALLSGLRTSVARWVAGATVTLTIALVQIPALAARLHLEPLHADDWAAAAAASLTTGAVLALGRWLLTATGAAGPERTAPASAPGAAPCAGHAAR